MITAWARRLVCCLALVTVALCAADALAASPALVGTVNEFGRGIGVRSGGPAPAATIGGGLQARLAGYRRAGSAVRVRLELRDFLSERWRSAVEGGGTLYVRIETELWEKRSLWDRLVQAAAVSVARITADRTAGSLVVVDQFGQGEHYPVRAAAVGVWADLTGVNRVDDRRQYYVHASVAVGTIPESQIAGMSNAVFGEESGGGLVALGRLVFQKVLRLADYLDSSSCELTGSTLRGADLKRTP